MHRKTSEPSFIEVLVPDHVGRRIATGLVMQRSLLGEGSREAAGEGCLPA